MEATDDVGYGNCDMYSNGEAWVIKNFIKANDIVFDVGANFGGWTREALKQNPKVIHAFEPVANFRLTCEQIVSIRIAVGSKNEVAKKFHVAGGDKHLSSFYERPGYEGSFYIIDIPVMTLDYYCKSKSIDKIDFLKIDVEGAEYEVLSGATELLKGGKINNIQFEYGNTYPDSGATLKSIYELLTPYKFSLARILPTELLPVKEWFDKLEGFRYSNYLATLNLPH